MSTVSLKNLICFLPLLCYIGSQYCDTWTPFRCPMGHPAVGSRGVSRLRDSNLKYLFALGFGRHRGSTAADVPVGFRSDTGNFNNRPRSFMTLRGLPVGRLVEY